jgi:hypothetical protein
MKTFIEGAVYWLVALLVVLILYTTFAHAQEEENNLCAPIADMHNAMLGQGYLNVFEGLVDTDGLSAFTLKLYVHPQDGDWMVHGVSLLDNEECHIEGGLQYMAPKIGELL